jgi:hypothetical protein
MTGPGLFSVCSEGAAAGTKPPPIFVGLRLNRCHILEAPWVCPRAPQAMNFNAAGRWGDNSPEAGAASGNAGREVAARCGAARHNCCRFPEAHPAPAASAPARDTPDSNTVLSNPADIASSL